MDFIDDQQIKEYCQEALDIAEQFGLHEGLSYLIGEKFCEVYRDLKRFQGQVKYVYGANRQTEAMDPLEMGGKAFKLNYNMTISENYRRRLNRVKALERAKTQFVREIKELFDIIDIQDYLNSYPRLGGNDRSAPPGKNSPEKVSSMTAKDVFSEVEDIFIVEDMKKLFV
ncbi:MAG: hypothetical protein HY579_10430 [Nitrospinae bacterium]|nr:hypothetical protein [Nitrospinota bacterium]